MFFNTLNLKKKKAIYYSIIRFREIAHIFKDTLYSPFFHTLPYDLYGIQTASPLCNQYYEYCILSVRSRFISRFHCTQKCSRSRRPNHGMDIGGHNNLSGLGACLPRSDLLLCELTRIFICTLWIFLKNTTTFLHYL